MTSGCSFMQTANRKHAGLHLLMFVPSTPSTVSIVTGAVLSAAVALATGCNCPSTGPMVAEGRRLFPSSVRQETAAVRRRRRRRSQAGGRQHSGTHSSTLSLLASKETGFRPESPFNRADAFWRNGGGVCVGAGGGA